MLMSSNNLEEGVSDNSQFVSTTIMGAAKIFLLPAFFFIKKCYVVADCGLYSLCTILC